MAVDNHNAIPDLAEFKGSIKLPGASASPEQCHLFDDTSANAIRCALAARRPLLVRGDPGVGKTQLAAAAAAVLKRPLITKVVDSRTEPHSLLWEMDTIRRLADAQVIAALVRNEENTASAPDDRRASVKEEVKTELSPLNYLLPGPLWWGFDWHDAMKQAQRADTSAIRNAEPPADPERGCVVLIDEIDKADADVPNGLLEALGSGSFSPPHRAAVSMSTPHPLVIITSNDERALPNPFVRRCLVHVITMPWEDKDKVLNLLIERARAHFHDGDAKSPQQEWIRVFRTAGEMLLEDRDSARRSLEALIPGQAEYFDLIRAVLAICRKPTEAIKTLESLRGYAYRKHGK